MLPLLPTIAQDSAPQDGLRTASAKFDTEIDETKQPLALSRSLPERSRLTGDSDRRRGKVLHRNCGSHNDLIHLSDNACDVLVTDAHIAIPEDLNIPGAVPKDIDSHGTNSGDLETYEAVSKDLDTANSPQECIPIILDQKDLSTASSTTSGESSWSTINGDANSASSDTGPDDDDASLRTLGRSCAIYGTSSRSSSSNKTTTLDKEALPRQRKIRPIEKWKTTSRLTAQLSRLPSNPRNVMTAKEVRQNMIRVELKSERDYLRKALLWEHETNGQWNIKSPGRASKIEALRKDEMTERTIGWPDRWKYPLPVRYWMALQGYGRIKLNLDAAKQNRAQKACSEGVKLKVKCEEIELKVSYEEEGNTASLSFV